MLKSDSHARLGRDRIARETQKRSTNDEAQVHAMAQSQAERWQITHLGITEMVHGIVRRGIRNDVHRWIRESIRAQCRDLAHAHVGQVARITL